ncbi:MFS transporter [Chimaeribacter arupi]|uniref:MFS transporter n=2 Tax=Yersiniaceae TaxID=1903411 RepID=A0A2N5ENF0_9GAMM|nr:MULTISPECIES: MFS transporter [Yersiniaceae]MBS0969450.1 MFS transporter [Nissabacter archeti]MDV5140233.1 MFS transporter [Chimaeribacter arupi]PLR30110.1 MFS transporter [Chimaeribacter arupi]PLR47542.1 MFS transporter [Chimaeribacter arupi]PLR50211.1 MFS transporter [Chimaeribacter arupi]
MPITLFALMLGVFCLGTAEIVISGLLPVVASDLSVSLPDAGLLVTGYALGVTIIGPFVTLLTSRVPRKTLVLGLMLPFILGNVWAVLASDYQMLMAARILTSISHGTFVAVAFSLAVTLSPPDKQGSAMAKIALGFNLANALGGPLGTFIGQNLGWRATFVAIVMIAVISVALIAMFMPAKLPQTGQSKPGAMRRELNALTNPTLVFAIITTVLAQGAVFTASTYIVPLLMDVSHFSPSAVSGLLIVFGIGAIMGNFAGGRLADKHVMRGVTTVLSSLVIVLVIFWATSIIPVLSAITLFLFGAIGFSIIPSLQARIQSLAVAAPTLALSVNVSAFNLGNGLGAWAGGSVLDLGFGIRAVPLAAAALAAISLLITLFAWRQSRQQMPQIVGS